MKLEQTRTFGTQISLILGIIAGILGIFGYVVKISMDYAKLKARVDDMEKDIIKHNELPQDITELKSDVTHLKNLQQENYLRIKELTNSQNKTNDTLVELSTTIKMMVGNINMQFDNLNSKIIELKGNK